MKDRMKQILKYKKTRRVAQAVMLVAGLIGAVGLLSSGEEASSIAVIGGADGPTSIFIAGKLGENAAETQTGYEVPELLAHTFLQTYFTVGHKDAAEILAAYEKEVLEAVESEHETEVLIQWDSSVLSSILKDGMYLFLTEEAKEKMLANRYLLRAYQLAAQLEKDLSVDGFEMTVAYEEEDGAGYEYNMTVKAGEELYQAQGDIRVIADEDLGWKIDMFSVTFE